MTNVYFPEGFSKSSLIQDINTIETAMSEGLILEGTATLCDRDMNLHVDLGGIKGIIPKSEILYLRSGDTFKDIAAITRVGKRVCFKVKAISYQGTTPYLLLSRRDAQEECLNNYISKLAPGDIIPARVTHLESFGAFADIGCGIISLLSVDCISVSRISHPKDRLTPGMPIYVAVKTCDRESGRIYLTMRELLGTWEENAKNLFPGQTVTGIIRSIESYGVFVELAPNLAGLAELKPGQDSGKLNSMIGKPCAVFIKSINRERMKIKLVAVDAGFEENEVQPAACINYYIDCQSTKHLDRWQYSPYGSSKLVETVF